MEVSLDITLQHALVLIVAAFIGAAISWIAYKEGFYNLPIISKTNPTIRLKDVFTSFGLFLLVEIILVPIALLIWVSWKNGAWVSSTKLHLSDEEQIWINMLGIVFTAIVLRIYYVSLNPQLRREIWGESSKISFFRPLYNWLFGAFTWVVAYPWMIVVGQLVAIFLLYTFGSSDVDQVAVKHVKDAVSNPTLLWTMIFMIVVIVPILEELLFRGFLQSWLKTRYGTAKSIVFSSFVFACFHYSDTQGTGNVELLSSLFVLACFLGFIKERQQSLWASIGLHSTFNLISIGLILLTK